MALSVQRKRARRAESAATRATDEAARGIKRRPPGNAPVGKRWDEHMGEWACGPLTVQTSSLQTLADAEAGPKSAHSPPRRAAYSSHEQWDVVREPWFIAIMGRPLPPYGDNEARSAAWKAALCKWSRYRADRASKLMAKVRPSSVAPIKVCLRIR